MAKQSRGTDKHLSQTASLEASVNDGAWRAFVLGLYLEVPAAAPLEQMLPWLDSFYDYVDSGIRERFSVISLSGLTEWANENFRAHEACKEFKSAVESGTAPSDLPATLMARVVKSYMLASKVAAFDARNQPTAGVEESVTFEAENEGKRKELASRQEKDKDVKPAEKNADKDRLKSGKKPTPPKTPGKTAESSSRRQSLNTSPEDVTHNRRLKLRDRAVARVPEKAISIGDEPPNGPTVYYILKGFPNLGLLVSLVEDTEVPVDAIVTARFPGTPRENDRVRVLGSCDGDMPEMFRTLSRKIESAGEGLYWKQTVLTEVESPTDPLATNQKEFNRILFDILARKVYHIVEIRQMYDAYFEQCSTIPVPAVPAEPEMSSLMQYFSTVLTTNNSCAESNLAENILDAMLNAVARNPKDVDGNLNNDQATAGSEEDDVKCISSYFNRKMSGLSGFDPPPLSSSSSSRSEQAERSGLSSAYKPRRSEGKALVERLPAAQYQRAVRKLGMMAGNDDPVARERVLTTQRLLSLTGQSEFILDQTLVILEFEKLMKEFDEEEEIRLDFNWRYWNAYVPLSANQIAKELQDSVLNWPIVRYRYLPKERILLLIMFTRVHKSNVGRELFAHQIPVKVPFSQYYGIVAGNLKSPMPVGAPYVYSLVEHIRQATEEILCTHLDDGVEIRIPKRGRNEELRDDYLQIVHVDGTLSCPSREIGKGGRLTFSCAEGPVIHVVRENNSTCHIRISAEDGWQFVWCNDGDLILTGGTSSEGVHSDVSEVRRIITSEGTVIRCLGNRSRQILYANGNTSIVAPDGSCVSTNNEGSRAATDAAGVAVEISPVRVVVEIQPGSRTEETTREDTVKVARDDETLVAYHADGTRITTKTTGDVIVESEQFGRVEILDHGRRTSAGVNRNLTFERLALPNGVEWLLRRCGHPLLHIKSDGIAILYPSQWAESETSDECTGRYVIDFAQGTAKTVGGKITASTAEIHVENESTRTVGPLPGLHLESEVLQAIASKDRQISCQAGRSPRLFVIREDGSGRVILHDWETCRLLRDFMEEAGTRTILQRMAFESSAATITAITSPDGSRAPFHVDPDSSSGNVICRQLICHKPIPDEVHEVVASALDEVISKGPLGQKSYGMNELGDLNYEDVKSRARCSRLLLLLPLDAGKGKDEALRELTMSAATRRAQKELEKQMVAERSKKSFFSALNARLNPGRRQRSADDLIRKARAVKMNVDAGAIPPYFESAEGRTFLQSLRKEEIRQQMPAPASRAPDIQIEMEEICPVEKDVRIKPGSVDDAAHSKLPTDPQKAVEAPALTTGDNFSVAAAKSDSRKPRASAANATQVTDAKRAHRKKAPPLPFSLRGAKPGEMPNLKYLRIESEVARKVTTASTAPILKGRFEGKKVMAGFVTYPSKCDFGTVVEGYTYQTHFNLTNIGNNTARFKLHILAAPDRNVSDYVQFSYRPGPVAAGMKVTVNVRLNALTEKNGRRDIRETVQIISASEILNVSIRATILPVASSKSAVKPMNGVLLVA